MKQDQKSAAILNIGSELTSGLTLNTGAASITRLLHGHGVRVAYQVSVPDDAREIAAALQFVLTDSRLIVVTGGLGPTADDLTREAVSRALQTQLVFSQEVYEEIAQRYRERGRTPPEASRKLADLIVGAEPLHNPVGAAPGQRLNHGGTEVFLLPGVPAEIEAMLELHVAPLLESWKEAGRTQAIGFGIAGLPESRIQDMVEAGGLQDVVTGYQLHPDGVMVRVVAAASERETLDAAVARIREGFNQVFGDYLFGEDTTLPEAIAELLVAERLTLAVAESCTGGELASRLIAVPGASRYVDRGFIVYSDRSKVEELGVEAALLREHGAVSEQTARAMAEGVRGKANADIGLSTTGIAGPTGATPGKPVGLVYCGLASKSGTQVKKYEFLGARSVIIERAVSYSLGVLYRYLVRRGL